jgi:hypothetical protein
MAQDTLADDVSGCITRIAVQVMSDLLESARTDMKFAYEKLLQSFLAGMHVEVLADHAMAASVETWLSGLGLRCSYHVAAAPPGATGKGSPWVRDAFLRGTRGGKPSYIRCHASKEEADQACRLSAIDGIPVASVPDVFLDGGDSLVGPDFRLAGINAVIRTADVAGHLCDLATAAARIRALDTRPLWIVGYVPQQIGNEAAATMSDPPLERLMQNWLHIDMVISLTGRKEPGTRGTLVVAETRLSEKPRGFEMLESNGLRGLSDYLRSIGFHVVNNPAPYVNGTLGYNNTIVQNDPDIVWLPQFAHDGRFADTDEENRNVWSDLGFKVIPVEGWIAFHKSTGSIRCATNVLQREQLAAL